MKPFHKSHIIIQLNRDSTEEDLGVITRTIGEFFTLDEDVDGSGRTIQCTVGSPRGLILDQLAVLSAILELPDVESTIWAYGFPDDRSPPSLKYCRTEQSVADKLYIQSIANRGYLQVDGC